MAKMTLLQMVQEILEAIDENPVNDISDTPAASKVSKIVRQVYDQEFAYGDWPHLRYIGQLTGLGDVTKPTVLKIPDAVARLEEVRYKYTDDNGNLRHPVITHIEDPQEFLDLVMSRTSSDSEVETCIVPSVDTVSVLVYNDRQPKYWTTFDDEYIVMDAYDSTVEASLQGANTLGNNVG